MYRRRNYGTLKGLKRALKIACMTEERRRAG